jgi:hypothetical protein
VFEYTDPDGDHFSIAPGPERYPHGPTVSLRSRPCGGRTTVVHVPHAHVEEVVAGIRDAARQTGSVAPFTAAELAAAQADVDHLNALADGPELPRRFHLLRHRDMSGISGTGVVALGVRWPDGTASVRWLGPRPSIVFWDRGGMADAEHVHGHGGATEIVWDDEAPSHEMPDGEAIRRAIQEDVNRAVRWQAQAASRPLNDPPPRVQPS